MRDAFDLAVIGAGPAGAACALGAARAGLLVALFEPQTRPIDKPCGEGIMPSGVDALVELGLGDLAHEGRALPALRFFLPGCPALDVPLPRAGLTIERPTLQRALDAALEDQADVLRFEQRGDAERAGDGFVVRARQGAITARTLAIADGLHGTSAPWLRGESSAKAPRFGLRARFEAASGLDRVEVHFAEGCEVYLTPLPDQRVNCAVLADGDSGTAQAMLHEALSRAPRAAAHLGARVTEPEVRSISARRPRCLAERGAFLVGDAGGSVDPILGCGTSVALETGLLAAHAVALVVGGDTSGARERAYARAYARTTRSRRALAALLLTLARRPSLARSASACTRAWPALQLRLVAAAAGAAGAAGAARSSTS